MPRRATLVSLVALVILAACGIPLDEEARPLAADAIPSSLPADVTAGPTTTVDAGPSSVEVYFVRESRLTPVHRAGSTTSVDGAIDALLRGPTPAERSEGIRSSLTREIRLVGTVSAGVPLVDLSESFADVEGEEQILALAQILFTLTALPGVEGVSFALAGRSVEVPTGDGTLKRGALQRQDFAAVSP